MNQMTYIDLFCGAGGFSLGFEWERFKNIFSLDIDKNCAKTYKHNFKNHHFIAKDISLLHRNEIIELTNNQKVDVVIGGPPCQGFSIAGSIGRKFIDDPRNQLFKEFVRVVDIVRPNFFIMENVAKLSTHNKGHTKKEIIKQFQAIGYNIESKILNAADYGVPQIRKRVVFIGTLLDIDICFPEPIAANYKTIKESIGHYPILGNNQKSSIANHIAMKHTEQMLQKMSYVRDGGTKDDIPDNLRPKSGDARKYMRYNSFKPSVCITGDMRKVFHYSQNRALTVRELACIQSFPDDFVFQGTSISQQQQVGNAVPPLMGMALAKCIKKMNNMNV